LPFYVPREKTVIANDALVIADGKFGIANPMFTLDQSQAIKSVELIWEIHPETIICYHGGIEKDNSSEKLTELIPGISNTSYHVLK
jgi:glyoxylase-like metal-dependent hydrolase (beta-lactamase superfamily II)